MKKLLVFLALFLMPSLNAKVFKNIEHLRSYANHYSENVEPDNKDWMQPDFTSFYKSQVPTAFTKWASALGFWRNMFEIDPFQKLIKEVTDSRMKNGYEKGQLLQTFTPKQGDKLYIWTDLKGAFHSMVRDLCYLNEQGVINKQFKIIDPHCYFVFNGNMVSGSAFQFETLSVLLWLMKVNPSRVFYVKGMEEIRWYNFTILKELKALSGTYLSNHEKMKQLIDNFYRTLPLGLYVTHKTAKELQVLVISNNSYVANRLNKRYLGQMVDNKEACNGFFEFKSGPMIDEMKKINIIGYITGEDREIRYRTTTGLTMGGTIAGAMKWLAFSSPTRRSQILYDFYYDAFLELTVQGDMPDWNLTLINQKIPEQEGFKRADSFNITTGERISDEYDTELLLGSTMDLSRTALPLGTKIEEGLLLSFYKERLTDSIPDLHIKLITADDEYTPLKTRKEVERLQSEKGIDIFIGSQGSAALEGYLDLVKDKKILVLFPFTGAPIFRKPELTHLIHFRGSYLQEGEVLARYAVDTFKAKTIVILYQDDAFGRGALEGAEKVLNPLKNQVKVVAIPHARNLGDYAGVAKEIDNANPDAILFFTNSNAIRSVIRQMGVEYFAGRKLLGLSVYEDAFDKFMKNKGLPIVLTRMVPDPGTSDLEIAKEYRTWANKRNVPYDKISFEQFINAHILFELLRKIDRPVTKEKIIKAADNMKNVSIGGLQLHFNPQTRELSDTLWLDKGDGTPWIKQQLIDEPLTHEQMEHMKDSHKVSVKS